MLVRWNYKLQPNKGQRSLMDEWLVTLRKHRNFSLRERKNGYEGNNLTVDSEISYVYGAYCDLDSRIEVGSCCPLTCAVLKHGVTPDQVQVLTKTSSKGLQWGNVSDIQSRRTTQLRAENPWHKKIDSDVLQSNLAKLDSAYSGFFKHERGFPAFRKTANFKSFQYKPGRAKLDINRDKERGTRYSHVYLPGIGRMRFIDSRPIPFDADIRTVTVVKKADGYHISVLLKTSDSFPALIPLSETRSAVGIDMGINKLISLSDGSFVNNPKFATNKKFRRLLRIRQGRVSRKIKGSRNRSKSGITVAKFHKKVADKRADIQWKASHKVVNTAVAVVREDLNIVGLKKRCKPVRERGRFLPNGQSAKRGLNRAISDASWGAIFEKLAWLCTKLGKHLIAVNPAYTSQTCPKCHHKDSCNRNKEKFICSSCGHADDADTNASRNILEKADFKFPKKDSISLKNLPGDSRKVTAVSDEPARDGQRVQGSNWTSKATPEIQIYRGNSIESPRL